MKKIYNIIIILVISFCLSVKANNDEVEELSEYMHINPKWTEYNNLSEEEKKNYEAIPEKYIYDYIPKKNTSFFSNEYNNKFYSYGDETLEDYYSLANVNGKRYINSTNKNQSSLGLCWAFAGIGSLESNILINGVKGQDEAIAKCDQSNPDSIYCKYKKDKELNDYYISNAIACESGSCPNENGTTSKKVIDNAKFSERQIDYLRSRPENATAYNNSNTYTLIAEKYNPYTTWDVVGSGGWFSLVAKYFSYGVSPIRMLEGTIWEKYTTIHNTITLSDLFDNPESIYQVTNYYTYPSAPSNTNIEAKQLWVDELKSNIKKYGSVYVSTNVPDSRAGTCYFYDSANNVRLINDTGSCGVSGGHAMQIVGWDDNYKFAYCKITTTSSTGTKSYSSSSSYTKETCEALAETTANDTTKKSGIWTEGQGAWILKNSWGTSTVYPYLSYQSTGLSIGGVREVRIADYDNAYNTKNTEYNIKTATVNKEKQTTYTYYKTLNKEYLNSINVEVSSYKADMSVYISTDGETYSLVDTQYVDYPGLYTFDIDNYELSGNKFFIKVTNATVSSTSAYTKNECSINNSCSNSVEIESVIQNEYDPNHYLGTKTDFNIITTSRNIDSGAQLDYKVYDSNGVDISSKFTITPNYVVNNSNKATMVSNEELPVGKYYLHTTHGNVTDIFEFYIINEVEVDFELDYPIFNTDSTKQIKLNITNGDGTSNYEWKSSNTAVATVDKNGLLTIKGYGYVDITLTMDTYYGSTSLTERIYIYKKIYSISEFFEMQSDNSVFYLMNDLDFSGVNFNNYDQNTFTGVFDGGGHTLKNITKTYDSSNQDIGLFNKTDGAVIRNFKIENSQFTGTTSAGSVVGYAKNTTIENVYNYGNVKSSNKTGGIIGESQYANIIECLNAGKIETVATKNYSYSGGLIGYSNYDNIENSYNVGKVYSETQWERISLASQAIAGGIVGNNKLSVISNSYNAGEVESYSPIAVNTLTTNGIGRFYNSDSYNVEDYIKNSYYLADDTYTITYSNSERSLTEMKTKNNYVNWDFNNVWYMEDGNSFPIFISLINNDESQVNFNIFSNILNENSTYDFTYEVIPSYLTDKTKIYSEDESLFEVSNNQIITKSKLGTANIVFEIEGTEHKYPITVKQLLKYDYNTEITNKDVDVDVELKYYKSLLDENSYLKLKYTINNEEKETNFNKSIEENDFSFTVSQNSNIKLELQVCGTTCTSVKEASFEITNIDKTKPEINIEYNNITSKLKINVADNKELNTTNVYEYALSNSSSLAPITFNTYTPNVEMNNIFMNHTMKYLWIKNISDTAGNKASLNDYIVYDLNINEVEAEQVIFEIFSNTLNYNKNYTFNYEVKPLNITNDVIISSEDESLFEINNNQIMTKTKSGTTNIKFNIGKKEFKYPIIIKDILEYNYDTALTNEDIDINVITNYFEKELSSKEYLKLIYKIGENEYNKVFENSKANNEFTFKVSNNDKITLNLYLCNTNCNIVSSKSININNIDKEKPVVNYIADTVNKSLQINVGDLGGSGLTEENIYKYAISNSNTETPKEFKEYTPNIVMNNINFNKEYKYLWVYNISDKVGNKADEKDYIIFEIDINEEDKYYNINYYDKDKTTILKTEKIKEGSILIINYKASNYEDSEYIYEFSKWEGYTEGTKVTKDINLYPIYNKTAKKISSNTFTIENGYIYNIKVKNIKGTYGVTDFKNNLNNASTYNFYENDKLATPTYLKTGLKFKNNYYEYKIALAGDVTGDGYIKMNDVMKIANHIVNKNVLYNEYYTAGDVTGDNNVKMNDIMKIASGIVNGGSL